MNNSIDTTNINTENAENPLHNRRIQDGIASKNSTRKMNLNRRHENSERRGTGDPNYNGPSRRYTIDRRINTRDRRQAS